MNWVSDLFGLLYELIYAQVRCTPQQNKIHGLNVTTITQHKSKKIKWTTRSAE